MAVSIPTTLTIELPSNAATLCFMYKLHSRELLVSWTCDRQCCRAPVYNATLARGIFFTPRGGRA